MNLYYLSCWGSPLYQRMRKKMKADKTWADWGIVMSVFVSRGDSQRVLYRPVNHMTAGSITTRFQLVQSHNCSSKIQSFFDTVTSNIFYCRVRLKGHTYSWVTYASTALQLLNFCLWFLNKHFCTIKILKYVSEGSVFSRLNSSYVHLNGLGHQLLV